MSRVRINVKSIANTAAVRTVTRNGREVMVVPSATLPDDVVMNNIQYPADEIESSYRSLEGTMAPFGHPVVNGEFVSSLHPEGLAVGYIGAWNENVRREGGRVLIDKMIDVEVANRSEDGQRVLAAINAGDPVHTSTGLMCVLEDAPEGAEYKSIARNMYFDHDAILLNESGAATPDQGVGMLVNKASDPETGSAIQVINSAVEWADRDLDWAVSSVIDSLERLEKASMVDQLKTVLKSIFMGDGQTNTSKGDDDMSVTDEQFNALKDTVDTLSEAVAGIPEQLTNAMKPLLEANEALVANQKAKDDAEIADLTAKIVKSNILTEDGAKGLTLNALRELAKTADPKGAAALNAAGTSNADEFADIDLNPKEEK